MVELLSIPLALFAAVALVFCVALTLHWGYKREESLIVYAGFPIVVIIILVALTSGRNLFLATELVTPVLTRHPLVVWGGRITSLLVLFAAGERIARQLLHAGSRPIPSTVLMFSFLLYFVTNVAFPAVLGTHVVIEHDYLYMVLAGCAALMVPARDGETAISAARTAIFFLLALSAIFLIVKPELVLSKGYVGLIPGLSVRYAGLSSHANTLGPLVVVFLLCLWREPLQWRSLNRFAWALGAMSLILAQSKTSWIAFSLSVSCVAFFHYGRSITRWIFDFRHPRLPAMLLLLALLVPIVAGLAFMFGDAGDKINAFFSSRAGGDLLSLTGRDEIWAIAIQEWHKNPMFGYGLTLWNQEFREQIGMPFAFHAHNQFFQSLSVSGTVGAVGLIIYITTLFVFVIKTAKISHGLSLALFALVILRSVSEIPLSMTGFDGDNLTHILLLTVVAASLSKQSVERAGHSAPVPAFPGVT
jgi:O-antigen ligase